MLTDSITNVLAQIGMGGDKAAHSRYTAHFTTREELMDAYRYAWLPRKLVDLPVHDALRQWRKWNGEPDDIEKLEAIEARLQVQQRTKEAMINARLFGASALLIHTDRRTMTAPMQPDEQISWLEVVDYNATKDGILSRFPSVFSRTKRSGDLVEIDGEKIHRSRLCFFRGAYVPGQEQGDSVITAAYTALRDADAVAANVAALVFEAKIDVFKIPNLMELVGNADYQNKLVQRLQLANHGKSVTNSLLMDTEEEYEQKSVGFGGLNEVLLTSLQIAAGATGIPATRLLGQSVSGIASTGDNEVRDYYDTVRGIQNNEITPALAPLDRLLLQNAGVEPTDFEWVSLWQETKSEKADNIGKLATAIGALAATALFPDDVLTDAAAQVLGDYMPAIEVTSDY